MKFHQVQEGQRFLYKDQVYIKVSPVIARHDQSGEQKFLRRADSVEVLADQSLPSTTPGMRKNIEVKKVKAMFDDFYSQCVSVIESELAAQPQACKEKIISQLQRAGTDFIQGLSGPGATKRK